MSQTISAVITDQFGVILTDVQAQFPRSWIINDTGKCEFILSIADNAVALQYLVEGNLLLIESDDGVPDWIGVIDDPQYWTFSHVKLTAYTPDYLLKYRRGNSIASLTPGHIGSYGNALRRTANACGGAQFAAGEIEAGGKVKDETLDTAHLLDELKRWATTYGMEYSFTPSRDVNGRVIINFNWMPRLGAYKPDLVIDDNVTKVVDDQVVYNGPIINDCLAFGNSGTWDSKGTSTYKNQSSIDVYGPRMEVAQLTSASTKSNEKSQLDSLAQTTVKASAYPQATFRLSLINAASNLALIQGIRLGDVVPFHSAGYGLTPKGVGLDCYIRVMGIAFEETTSEYGLSVVTWNGNL